MNILTRSESQRQTTFNSLASFVCYPSMLMQLDKVGLNSPTAQICPQEPITQSLSILSEQRQAQSV